jgi:hypothetical protein
LKESASSKRKITALDVEKLAIELRSQELTFPEIAEEMTRQLRPEALEIDPETGKPPINEWTGKPWRPFDGSTCRKAVERAMKRQQDVNTEAALQLKDRMVQRCKLIVETHVKKLRNGEDTERAARAILDADERLCQLEGIKLYKPEQIEVAGTGGGAIPIHIEALPVEVKLKMLNILAGDDGPPEEGFIDARGDAGKGKPPRGSR